MPNYEKKLDLELFKIKKELKKSKSILKGLRTYIDKALIEERELNNFVYETQNYLSDKISTLEKSLYDN